MDKENVHNGDYSAIRKNEIMSFVGKWMELESIMLSEMSDSERRMLHIVSYY
jgi:hypothetical protein